MLITLSITAKAATSGNAQSTVLLAAVILLQHPDEALILDFNQLFGTLSQDQWCCGLNFLISNDPQMSDSTCNWSLVWHHLISRIMPPSLAFSDHFAFGDRACSYITSYSLMTKEKQVKVNQIYQQRNDKWK